MGDLERPEKRLDQEPQQSPVSYGVCSVGVPIKKPFFVTEGKKAN